MAYDISEFSAPDPTHEFPGIVPLPHLPELLKIVKSQKFNKKYYFYQFLVFSVGFLKGLCGV